MKANNNNKIKKQDRKVQINYGLTTIFVGIMALITVAFIALYPNVKKNVDKHMNCYGESEFLNNIGKTNYILAGQTQKEPNDKQEMIQRYLELSKVAASEQELVKSDFNGIIKNWSELVKEELINLEYYAVNGETGKVETNNGDLSRAVDNQNWESISNGYAFYTVFNVDDKGAVSIKYVKGTDKTNIESYLNTFVKGRGFTVSDYFTKQAKLSESEWNRYNDENYIIDGYYDQDSNRYNSEIYTDTYTQFGQYGENTLLKPVKNMTYVYAVKENLAYYDSIYQFTTDAKQHLIKVLTIFSVLAAMALMALLTLIVPYRNEREMAASRVVIRFPLEIIVALFIFAGYGVALTAVGILPSITSSEMYSELKEMAITGPARESIVYGAQFISVFLCLMASVFGIVAIKNIFHVGILKYIKENSLVVRCIRFVWREMKKAVRVFTTIDLSKDSTHKLLLLIAANAAITFVLCCMFVFGAFISIGYNVAIFVLIRKRYLEIEKDYHTLSEKTKIIAEGNLETSIEEELGIFNSLKEDINHIKDGLKNAVDEEVKSQNLKTELITNVSHDLKTPLTSIITYVDLLKDEAITDEQRKEYIGILESKSQRLKVLIEDLFEMSKTTTNNIVLNYQNLDLVTLTKEVFVEFQDKIEEVPLSIKNEFKNERVICYLDSQRTYRILENLYGNLIKYAMPNTRVYVTVAEEEGRGIITMKNISFNELNFEGEHLMERFVRGDVSRNTEGSGLGLAIAKGLVEAQGGTMKIEIDGDLFKVMISFPISSQPQMQECEPAIVEEAPIVTNDWMQAFYEQPDKEQAVKEDKNEIE